MNDRLEKQNLQRQVQINRQAASKIRQAPAKKDATPIKEEDIEEEFSDPEHDPRQGKKLSSGRGHAAGSAAGAQANSKASLDRKSSGSHLRGQQRTL